MSLRFTCPHCRVTTDVRDEFSGQTGPCGTCGQSITIPLIAETPDSPTPPKRSNKTLVVLLGILAVCILAAAWLFTVGPLAPPPKRPPPPLASAPMTTTTPWAPAEVDEPKCSDNLRRISQAMRAYHSVHGSFPPAYLADDEGRPTHSWRALLLPYLDDPWVGARYDFDEPWDGPNNQKLLSSRPDVFHCPNDAAAGDSDTSYMMIVGPNTISDGVGSYSLAQITDYPDPTLLVVEVSHSGVAWSEPTDLDAEAITYLVNDGSPQGIRGDHNGGAITLHCDGSVRWIEDEQEAEITKAWSTPAGGEEL